MGSGRDDHEIEHLVFKGQPWHIGQNPLHPVELRLGLVDGVPDIQRMARRSGVEALAQHRHCPRGTNLQGLLVTS